MEKRKYTAEQIVTVLRQVEVAIFNGMITPQACRDSDITVPTYYRWHKEFGRLNLEQGKNGEPDLRQYLANDTEVWSYPYKPNSNDIAAAMLMTTSKEGDEGTFLDLKFVGCKLVSWDEAKHTMPRKDIGGFGVGIGRATQAAGPGEQGLTHY